MHRKAYAFFPLLLIAAIVLPIFALVPLHSDDFIYALKGVSPAEVINHYLTWSGRLLADTASSAILSTRLPFLPAVVGTVLMTAMLYCIAAIPFGRERNAQFALNLILLFLIYWVGNPVLGQTTLWAVGAANYLYANAILCVVLYLLVLHEVHGEQARRFLILPLAFLAGVGNENMSIAIITISLLYIGYCLLERRRFPRDVVYAFACYIAGSLVLLLAPGNFARLQHRSFEAWRGMPFLDRLETHFLSRIPSALPNLWLPIAIALVVMGWSIINRKGTRASILFAIGAVVSVAAMGLSPTFPNRSLNPTLVLLLLVISTSLPATFQRATVTKNIAAVVLVAMLPFSIAKIANQYASYASIHRQDQIRQRIIRGGGTEIPAFYIGMFLDLGDAPMSLHHAGPMGRYYGTGPVRVYQVEGDYGSLDFRKFDPKRD